MIRFWESIILSCVLVVALTPTRAHPQAVQEVAGAGSVDWSAGVIRATGTGAPPGPNIPESARQIAALESARQDALKRLFETIKAVNISSETTVGSYISEHPDVGVQVRRVLKAFREVGEPRHLSDLSVEVDIEATMHKELADLLLPETGGGLVLASAEGYFCPVCGQPWPADKPVPPEVLKAPTVPAPPATAHTGLIVDARGLGAQPAIAPRVLSEDGSEVYGAGFVDREFALSLGLLAYANDLELARARRRVGPNPLVVKALRATGTRKADLVISDRDAKLIHGAAENLKSLSRCGVVIVL